MPDILLHTGNTLRSEDVASGRFWEAGAELSRGFKEEPQGKVEDDTLALEMKDPETKFNQMTGQDARRIAEELEKAGVQVYRRLKE